MKRLGDDRERGLFSFHGPFVQYTAALLAKCSTEHFVGVGFFPWHESIFPEGAIFWGSEGP